MPLKTACWSPEGDALERFEAPEAALADIELAHDRMYVARCGAWSDRLNEELMAGGPSTRSSTPTPPSTPTPGRPPCHRRGAAWLPPMP